MSDTMQREFTRANVPGAPGVPSVNLLPPQVHARRRVAAARRWAVLVVLLAILGVGLAAVWAESQQKSAAEELVLLQDQNTDLTNQQAQYAEVTEVLNDLTAHLEARSEAMSTEVVWSPYLAAISSATPEDASIDSFAVTQASIWTPEASVPAGPLATVGTVGTATLNGRALTLGDVSDWEDALSALTGVVDVEVTGVEVADDEGDVYYAVAATFALTPDAYANRYVMEQ